MNKPLLLLGGSLFMSGLVLALLEYEVSHNNFLAIAGVMVSMFGVFLANRGFKE